MMQEQIFDMAKGFCSDLSEDDALRLRQLCQIAEQTWRAKLRRNVCPEDCLACFVPAVAYSAVAQRLQLQRAQQPLRSLTAGELSYTLAEGISQEIEALERRAEGLLLSYLKEDSMQFREVYTG